MELEEVLSELELHMPAWYGRDKLLLLTLVGSRGYGLHTKESDWDFFAVVAPPENCILGISRWEGMTHQNEQRDIKVYSPKKYMELCMKGSVNSLEPLFMKAMYKTQWMRPWLSSAEEFVTTHTISSILGYVSSTKLRYREIRASQHGDKRRVLIERYGYDTSAAAHCVRWLWIGLDLVRNPGLALDPLMGGDEAHRSIVRAIKNGGYSAEAVQEIIEEKESTLVDNYSEILYTKFPEPDPLIGNRILIELHRKLLGC